ncbi:hypothetical protein BLNAU_10061 [Blattamonas nauphoetae]|uniref:Uncharacterized protein n=1 Tax=Blattamonas nauphoetae TaxID=2049346 RepID=A0ABQ9XTW5_9EUKA|nr:hypothetical protein BLNAU_10061 [Blattamonas nauphoetae]
MVSTKQSTILLDLRRKSDLRLYLTLPQRRFQLPLLDIWKVVVETPLVNVMYHNPALRTTCMPKCIEILDLLSGKLEDKRLRVSTVLTQLYPSPDGTLDTLFDSLTLLAQLSTHSQMLTIVRFYVSLGGLSLNTTFPFTSHKWFVPFFLMIVDFGLRYACEKDKAGIVADIVYCLSQVYQSSKTHPLEFILTR